MHHVGKDLGCCPGTVNQAMQGIPVIMQGLPDIGSDPRLPGPKSTVLAFIFHITNSKPGQNQTHKTTADFVA